MLKKIVKDEGLWDDQLRDVCIEVFNGNAGKDRSIDVVEFECWLNVDGAR